MTPPSPPFPNPTYSQPFNSSRGLPRKWLRQREVPPAKCLLKPAKNGHLRLAPWQMTNHLPTTNLHAYLTDDEQVVVAKCILSFRCTINRRNARAIQDGTLQLAPNPLRIKGHLDWAKHCPPNTSLADELAHRRRQHASTRTAEHAAQAAAQTLALTCTSCNATRDTRYMSLLNAKGWRYVWCPGTCKRAWLSKRWHCVCGKLWHQCTIHSHGDFYTPPTPITTSRRASLRKRKPPTDSCPVPAPPHKMRDARAPTRKRRLPNAQPASDPTPDHTPDAPTPTFTPPAASPACLTPPPDAAAPGASRKASGKGEKRKASEGFADAAYRARPRPTGPDSLTPKSPAPPARQARSDAGAPSPDPTPPGSQGQKRLAALLPAILAKSARLASKFAHLKQ